MIKPCHFLSLAVFVLCLAAMPFAAVAQDAGDPDLLPQAVEPSVTPNCFTQNGTDMCVFEGPSGNAGTVRIGYGLGYLWYGSPGLNGIVRATATGTTKTYTIPTGGAEPLAIVLGPDKRMWFSEWDAGNIGAITASGKITEYPLGFSPSEALDIKIGADKDLWMATDHNGILRITTDGTVTAFSLPDGNDAQPTSLTLGPDKDIWFLEANGPCLNSNEDYTNIGRVTTSGVIKEYKVGLHGNGFGIAAGPDGRIWFADPGGCDGYVSRIGAINTDGAGLKYYTADLPPFVDTIINGEDGNLYFGTFSSQIGRITTAGAVTVWNLPSTPAFPVLGMTVGPDKNIWFVDNAGDYMGAIYIHPVISSFSPSDGPTGTAVTIKGYGFTGASSVTFGGVAAEFNVKSGFLIDATVPPGAVTGKIEVTNAGGTATSSKTFTVN